ncbi:hypothetical protein NPX13_g1406 [Xylaria arbuscula]|uniref:Uncharacterized protein n=1 Tax=Xylaria arbuscula TaxID=114810 RepID=A0A9W8TRV3_9PEZI|nr:hypothetical protein NPX13_g1406 [Xylaria arbuscula]
MPRTLPWKRREQQVFESPDSARSSPVSRIKREDIGQGQDGERSSSLPYAEALSLKVLKRHRRSASTSPPPEPLQESFMIEGMNDDDQYRMVEDELLTIAHRFTAHLHAAEYKRLKATSELENAQTIKNISRPVVGQKTDHVKMKQERRSLAEKQRLATRELCRGNASGDESTGAEDNKNSWQKQSLHGLLESPGKRAKNLSCLPMATSVTRAAAGFDRRSIVVSPSRPKSKPLQLSSPTHHHGHGNDDGVENSASHGITHRSPRPRPSASRLEPQFSTTDKTTEGLPRVVPKPSEEKVASDDDDLDIMARLKKRQEQRRRNREQRRSTHSDVKSTIDDILPGFL